MRRSLDSTCSGPISTSFILTTIIGARGHFCSSFTRFLPCVRLNSARSRHQFFGATLLRCDIVLLEFRIPKRNKPNHFIWISAQNSSSTAKKMWFNITADEPVKNTINFARFPPIFARELGQVAPSFPCEEGGRPSIVPLECGVSSMSEHWLN